MALLTSAQVMAMDGQRLHDEACIHCHASLTGGNPSYLYTRKDRSVTTFAELQKRVDGCAVAADVDWSYAQKSAVVKFLAQQFYRF